MQRRAAWLLLGVSCTLLLLLSWAQRGHQVKKEHSQPSKEVLEGPDPSGSALPTPKAQLSAICALPEFRRGASLNATVVVFAWRRLESLRRLMRSLEHAEYCGAEVPLLVIADAGASDSVLEFVRGAKWSHGERRVEAHQGPSLGTTARLRQRAAWPLQKQRGVTPHGGPKGPGRSYAARSACEAAWGSALTSAARLGSP